MRRRLVVAAAAAACLSACGMVEIIPKDVPRGNVIPEISNTMLSLIDQQERGAVSSGDYASDSIGVISTLKTPAGLRLRLRYQELGVSLMEALQRSRDQDLMRRLVEFAQWSQGRRVRSEALVTVAGFSRPDDLAYFRTALSDLDVGIRFAAVEGVQRWGQAGATEFLRDAMRDPWSPLLRVFAAQATLSLGNSEGLPVLVSALDDRSWMVRALAANYLGDYGGASEEDVLLRALNRETRNDFVAAELCIAQLKIIAREKGNERNPAPVSAPPRRVPPPSSNGLDNVVEMEPLVLQPPRLQIPASVRLAQTLNQRLLQIIQTRLDQPIDPSLQTDTNYQDLNKLVTPAGFALQTRYSELSVAVAEGLAGTTDPLLRSELQRLADTNRNAVTRATALLSLAYARSDEDLPLIRSALGDRDPIVRFGALEAAQAGRYRIVPALQGVAASDPVPAFRLFAVQVLLSLNEPSAYTDLVSKVDDPDWVARAMAYWYLGRYGKVTDYTVVLNAIAREKNPFVQAEATLAAQRLAPPDK